MAVRTRKRHPNDHSVTIEEGRAALVVAARLVDLYGDIYLPLFERMERDLINLYRREAARERARLVARTGDLSAYEEAAKGDPFTILDTFDWTKGARDRS